MTWPWTNWKCMITYSFFTLATWLYVPETHPCQLHTVKYICLRIGYANILSIISCIASKGVLEVEQISTLDVIFFPDEVKPFVCFLETFIIGSEAAFVCSVAGRLSRWRKSKKSAVHYLRLNVFFTSLYNLYWSNIKFNKTKLCSEKIEEPL